MSVRDGFILLSTNALSLLALAWIRLLEADNLRMKRVAVEMSAISRSHLVAAVAIMLVGASMLVAPAIFLRGDPEPEEQFAGDPDVARLRAFVSGNATAPTPAIRAHVPTSAANETNLADVETMITQLSERLRAQPDNGEGWRMLGWSYFYTDRIDLAANAYGKAWSLLPSSVEIGTSYAEALVVSEAGAVGDRAMNVLSAVLRLDPGMPKARFYAALGDAQRGRRAQALQTLRHLRETVSGDEPWITQLHAHTESLTNALHEATPPAR